MEEFNSSEKKALDKEDPLEPPPGFSAVPSFEETLTGHPHCKYCGEKMFVQHQEVVPSQNNTPVGTMFFACTGCASTCYQMVFHRVKDGKLSTHHTSFWTETLKKTVINQRLGVVRAKMEEDERKVSEYETQHKENLPKPNN